MARKKVDQILLITTLLLLGLGFLILFSVSAPISMEKYGNSHYFIRHQAIFGILPGMVLVFLAFRVDLAKWKKWAPVFFLVSLFFLALVFVPWPGSSVGGARRWLSLGNFSFQPVELLKISLPFYLASWLEHQVKRKKIGQLSSMFQFLLILTPVALALIFQPNISSLAIIIGVALIMYFLAETPFWHTLLLLGVGFATTLFLIQVAPYRMERLMIFLNPEFDPLGMGYQLKQSYIAIGSGGLWGVGLGMSKQKLGFVPNPMSDSPFAIFAEETGFLGVGVLIALFLVFLLRGVTISRRAKSQLLQLFGLGLTFQIVLGAFINIAAMSGVLPLTGTPLPFISYGGSHLVAELIGVGVLLNISRNT